MDDASALSRRHGEKRSDEAIEALLGRRRYAYQTVSLRTALAYEVRMAAAAVLGGNMSKGFHRLGLLLGFFPLAAGVAILFAGNGNGTSEIVGFCFAATVGVYALSRAVGWVLGGFFR